jgi:hypothetical protein
MGEVMLRVESSGSNICPNVGKETKRTARWQGMEAKRYHISYWWGLRGIGTGEGGEGAEALGD